jgi:hypothetical protein
MRVRDSFWPEKPRFFSNSLPRAALTALVFSFVLIGCDLLNNKPEIDVEQAMDAEIAWANAPYVPVRVEEGGLGTASPRGALDDAVKLGYSFFVNYVPKNEYPFRGWQAKLEGSAALLASWTATGHSGADKIEFVPRNEAGTEVEIFVCFKPEQRIIIGPLGADSPELSLKVDEGGTGTASPRGSVAGVRPGFPFSVSFLPHASYDFYGWQARLEGSGDLLGSWNTGTEAQEGELISFVPQNIAGTEIAVTIHQDPGEGTIVVEPLNGNNPLLAVELAGGSLGSITPTGNLTGIKQGFAFGAAYLPSGAYPFRGWQARLAGHAERWASWTTGETIGAENVMFTPRNSTGTEVRITVLQDPRKMDGTQETISIGPLGMDNPGVEVEVYYPEGWGRSPQYGSLSDVLQDFPFDVDFTVSAAYAFTEWRAYPQASLDKTQVASGTVSTLPLPDTKAVISGGTDGKASITLNTAEGVILIPWCVKRPQITQTSPPLINAGVSYSRGQIIKIWFDGELKPDPDNIKFSVGHIEITGQQTIGESSGPYDDPSTTGVNENGDLTGRTTGTSRFFKAPEYDPGSKTITIRPGDGGSDGTREPPGEIVITVTVGTEVLNLQNKGMASPVSFYYRTNTLEARNVYTAENIWAIHNPADVPSAEKFFYAGADTGRDRRLRKNASGNYEVTLYFTVQASNPAEMTDPPNKFNIAELRYANLAGGEVMSYGGEKNYSVTAAETEAGTAGAIYRQNNSGAGAYYKITCEWAAPPSQPGIYRLIVLPYRHTGPPNVFTETGDFAPDTWRNAHAEGRFAAVVLDDQAPSGSTSLVLGGQASVSGGVYYYGSNNKTLTLTGNFSNVADNGNAGIPLIAASMDKPWTMDGAEGLAWKYQIEVSGGTSYESSWESLNVNTIAINDLSAVMPNVETVRDIRLKYKDSLGNESSWQDTDLRISYYQVDVGSIMAYDASYNPDDNTITVTWTTPSGTSNMELSVAINGGAAQIFDKATAENHVITGVPRLNVSGVISGTSVSNVYSYEITLRARSVSDSSVPVSFKIWNIGTPGIAADPARGIVADIPWTGMSVDQDNLAVEIRTRAELAAIPVGAISSGKTYVLADDIDLTGNWTPIGGSDPFQGNFYGNGHRITGVKPDGTKYTKYMGLFGCVENAIIRDLEVVYDNATGVTRNSETGFGGIAGYAKGKSLFTNVLVKGESKVIIVGNSSGVDFYAGGVVGQTQSGSADNFPVIRNIYSGLNLTGETTGVIHAGGVAGVISGSNLWDCAVRGNLNFSANNSSHVGGLVGLLEKGSAVETKAVNCSYSGGVITFNSNAGGIYLGGAMGYINNDVGVLNCVSGAAALNLEKYGSGLMYFGGFAGYVSQGADMKNCSASTPVAADNGPSASDYLYAGGFAGYLGVGGSLEGCFATGAVRAVCYAGQFTGGLIGYSEGAGGNKNTITRCYAKGTVTTVNRSPSQNHYSGGLAGNLKYTDMTECYARGEVNARSEAGSAAYGGGLAGYADNSNVRNCYALGDVMVDSISYISAAGGLIGGGTTPNIEYCFAQGAVTAQTASSYPYAGGIAGFTMTASYSLSHNAALNRSLTAMGLQSNIAIGRVAGSPVNSPTLSVLYAFSAMAIRTGPYGTVYFPTTPSSFPGSTTTPSPTGAANNKNGADASNTNTEGGFKTSAFWTKTLDFNSGGDSPAGIWNTNVVASRGYPTLVNVGGQ